MKWECIIRINIVNGKDVLFTPYKQYEEVDCEHAHKEKGDVCLISDLGTTEVFERDEVEFHFAESVSTVDATPIESLYLAELHQILIDKTIECELEGDANSWNIEHYFEIAKARVQETDAYKQECKIERLHNYVSENDVREAYFKLVKHSDEGSGIDLADYIIDMWEPLVNKYTVDELLEEL